MGGGGRAPRGGGGGGGGGRGLHTLTSASSPESVVYAIEFMLMCAIPMTHNTKGR